MITGPRLRQGTLRQVIWASRHSRRSHLGSVVERPAPALSVPLCGRETLVPEGQSPAQTGVRWTGMVEPEAGWRNGLWRAED